MSSNGSRLPGVNFYSWIDKKMPAVKMFQIIQKSERNITFKYVQNADHSEDIHSEILSGLTSRLGNMDYDIMKVSEIPRDEKTQKIRSIINQTA